MVFISSARDTAKQERVLSSQHINNIQLQAPPMPTTEVPFSVHTCPTEILSTLHFPFLAPLTPLPISLSGRVHLARMRTTFS